MSDEIKSCHLAKLIKADGSVSALCAKKPKRINLKTDRWTNRPQAVTCKKCRKIIEEKGVQDLGPGVSQNIL